MYEIEEIAVKYRAPSTVNTLNWASLRLVLHGSVYFYNGFNSGVS